MPRNLPNPLPERPARNELGDRFQDIMDRVGIAGSRGDTNASNPRLEDLVNRRADRDGSGPDRVWDTGEGAFTPRDGVHDLLRTHEGHNDWFFS